MIRKVYTIQCKLKQFKTSELIFSCIRSAIAYGDHKYITCKYKNKNTILSSTCNKFNKCNIVIQNEVQTMVNNIHNKPIFYDGLNTKYKRDSQGYCVWDTENIYITYRGTADLKDIYDNIDIRHEKLHENIRIHKGFYNQFMSIEEKITNDIKHISNEYPIKNIIFAGHSMGGSLATISSPFYGAMFKNKFKIISHTLGCPTVGNIDFINWFSSNVDENVRIECEGDVVPYIRIHDHFYHVPNGLRMNKDGTLSDEYTIKPYNYSTLFSMIINKDKWNKINIDHSCENYVSQLFSLKDIVCFD
jgi:hypothetical protein